MIDWWVISSVLAGLGTAYGANVYNTKDATELRKKAAELIASSETKEWADRVKDLQARLDRAQQDNKRAEELVAQLQTAATGVQSGITTTMSDLQGQLQAETSPVQSQLATAPQETYGRALAMVLTELQQRYGISVTPKMDGVLKQFERNRHSIRDLWAALKEAYEKDTAPKGGRTFPFFSLWGEGRDFSS
jgi:hypothetical protein